jgi:hypothetical protein
MHTIVGHTMLILLYYYLLAWHCKYRSPVDDPAYIQLPSSQSDQKNSSAAGLCLELVELVIFTLGLCVVSHCAVYHKLMLSVFLLVLHVFVQLCSFPLTVKQCLLSPGFVTSNV